MRRLGHLRRDEKGGAVVEMAIALPVLILMIYGIFESAMLLKANAGIQHAIGEGARLATIYPTPSSTAVENKVSSELFGMDGAKATYPRVTVTPGTGAPNYYTISVTYVKTVKFLFLASRDVTITHSKRVYRAQ